MKEGKKERWTDKDRKELGEVRIKPTMYKPMSKERIWVEERRREKVFTTIREKGRKKNCGKRESQGKKM